MEQNRRIFEGARAEEVDHLWDRVKCMALFGRWFLQNLEIAFFRLSFLKGMLLWFPVFSRFWR